MDAGRGPKKWDADLPRRPIADKFLHGVTVPATSVPNFNVLVLLVSEIEGEPKFNVGATSPLPYSMRWLKLLCMLQVLGKIKQPAKFQHRISMHHAVVA